jgi:hypothetical protein
VAGWSDFPAICPKTGQGRPTRLLQTKQRAKKENKHMSTTPKGVIERATQVRAAWGTIRSDAKFAGMTLADFDAKVKASQDARVGVEVAESQRTAAIDHRDSADLALNDTIQLVVNSVKGDPAAGPDSELYEAMGYVRKSDRSTGLHRGKAAAATAK